MTWEYFRQNPILLLAICSAGALLFCLILSVIDKICMWIKNDRTKYNT
jgi:hypothetical protein